MLAVSFAQRGNQWRFGINAGLDFNGTTPVPVRSSMLQLEGCASISDLNGQLLFYSDGVTVWNSNNAIMPNGTGLWGNFSSTQSAMIIPFPGDENRYYIFTVDQLGSSRGLCYSVVNMLLNNGNGDLELKNMQLLSPSCEKITSVNHCNGRDIWVIANQHNTTNIYAYLVTAAGVNTPEISNTGVQGHALGYLKASPDGTRLVNANYLGGLNLYDFNDATGAVTNRRDIYMASPFEIDLSHYGAEFSPNSQVLYVTNSRPAALINWYSCQIRQYHFLDSSTAKIKASMVVLDADSAAIIRPLYAALQLGPDGRIYLANATKSSLSVISKPDRTGLSCQYTRNAQPLLPDTRVYYGLPDFNQSYFKGTFGVEQSCTSTTARFFYTRPNNASFVQWDFGDPGSGANNTSFLDSPSHTFSAPGLYTVRLVTGLACRNDTMTKMVKVDPLRVSLGPDTAVCDDSLLVLDPRSGTTRTWLWQDNSTAPTLTATGSGWYWVEVTNPANGCTLRDSLLLTRKPNPLTRLGNDTTLCENSNLLLNAGNPGAAYWWQDNSRNKTFLVKRAGQYFVKADLNGCIDSDTIEILYRKIPTVFLGNDTAICPGMNMTLQPVLQHAAQADLLWSTGETTPFIQVTAPGTYSLQASNNCGTAGDAVIIRPGICQLCMPTAFTPNSDGKNDILKPGYGENVTGYQLEIFNREGQKLFISRKIHDGWDGKYKGLLQPTSIYIWQIRYTVAGDQKQFIQKGTAALIY